MILVSAAIIGCKDKPPEKPEQAAVAAVAHAPMKQPVPTAAPEPADEQDSPVILEHDDVVLASVNGEPVTQYDFSLTIRSVLKDDAVSRLDKPGLRKALDSLIASRAIAQVQEAGMSDEDLAALEKKVRAHREELLVSRYLAEHTAARPVTGEMIQEYYNSHPERFGGKTTRIYEMIATSRRANSRERKILTVLLGNARAEEDWKEWAETLRNRGYPVVFLTGQTDEKVLHPQLHKAVQSLEKGETSSLIFINGMCYVARITYVAEIGPRPLKEVSARIRKSLGPAQIRKAIKEASGQVLEKAEVIYENDPKKPQ